MGRRTFALAAVALTVCGGAAPAALAAPRPALELGVQDDPVFVRAPTAYFGAGRATLLGPARAFALLDGLGVSVVRMNVAWAEVAPVPRAPAPPADPAKLDLARYERAIDAVRARGLRVQLTLTGPAPAWATANHRVGALDPDPRAFAVFAGAVARRLAGRVARYAIWNEPNWPGHLEPRARAPRIYATLYRAARRAVRRAAPGVPVLFGELAPMGAPEPSIPPLRFLRAATCRDRRLRAIRRCAPLVADGVALHPYTLRWGPGYPGRRDDATTGSLARLRRVLRRIAAEGALHTPSGAAPPLFLTEWAYHAHSRRVPEPLRSAYVARALRRIAATPGVRQVIWYQLAAPPSGPRRPWDTALVSRRGALRPAYRAIAGWARRERTRNALALVDQRGR